MVGGVLTTISARADGPADRLLEVTLLCVVEHIGQIARRPELALAILRRFAASLRQDYAVVKAAAVLPTAMAQPKAISIASNC